MRREGRKGAVLPAVNSDVCQVVSIAREVCVPEVLDIPRLRQNTPHSMLLIDVVDTTRLSTSFTRFKASFGLTM